VRWWHSPVVVAAIGLTERQVQDIDQTHQERQPVRRQCVERLVEASNRLNQLIRDGFSQEDFSRQTQEISQVAADERALTRRLSDEIAALLSPEQRQLLAHLRPGHIVE